MTEVLFPLHRICVPLRKFSCDTKVIATACYLNNNVLRVVGLINDVWRGGREDSRPVNSPPLAFGGSGSLEGASSYPCLCYEGCSGG